MMGSHRGQHLLEIYVVIGIAALIQQLVDLVIISILHISNWLTLEKREGFYYEKLKQPQPAACCYYT
mgnify:CR=1 FL=1